MSAPPSPVPYEGSSLTASPSVVQSQNVSSSPTPAPSFRLRYRQPDEEALPWLAVILLLLFVYSMCCVCKRDGSPSRRSVPATGQPLAEGASRDATLECMSAEERRDHVTKLLIVEKFHGATPSKEFNTGPLDVSQSFYFSTSAKDAGELCAIYLEHFHTGEDVCVSHNAKCNHRFHSTCALEWLLKSQLCPCCRRDYFARRSIVDKTEGEGSMTAIALDQLTVETEDGSNQGAGPIDGTVAVGASSDEIISPV